MTAQINIYFIFFVFFRDAYYQHFGFHCPGSATLQTSPVVLYTHTGAHTHSQLHRDYGEATAKQPQPVHTTHKCQLAVVIGSGLAIISI